MDDRQLTAHMRLMFVVFSLTTVIIFVILMINFHYWAYGANSATGWYDERDYPLVIARLLQHYGSGFSPLIAGGSHLSGAFYPTSHGSFLTGLVQTFGWHYGWAVYRVLGPSIFCISFAYFVYARTRHISGLMLGATAGFVALYGMPYAYGWILGGYFYSIMLAFMAAYMVVSFRELGLRQAILLLIGVSALQKIDPGTLAVFVPAFLSCLGILLVGQKPIKKFPPYVFLAFVFILVNLVVNYSDVEFLQSFGKDSARALKRSVNVSTRELISMDFDVRKLFGPLWFGDANPISESTPRNLGNTRWIFSSLAVFIVASAAVDARHKRIFVALVIYVFSYPLLALTIGSLEIAKIYRLEQSLIFGFPAVLYLGAILADDLFMGTRNGSRKKRVFIRLLVAGTFSWLIVVTAVSVKSMHLRTANNMSGGLVWSRLYSANALSSDFNKKFPELIGTRGFIYESRPRKYRVRHEHMLEVGAKMLGGNRHNFTEGRTVFWSQVLSVNPVAAHTARQIHNSFRGENVNIDMLRLAGVGYLVTNNSTALLEFGLTPHLLGTLPAIQYEKSNVGPKTSFKSFLDGNLKDAAAQDLYLWPLQEPTPIVFYATDIVQPQGQSRVEAVKNVSGCDVVLDQVSVIKKDVSLFSDICESLLFEYNPAGLSVKDVRQNSIVVLNHTLRSETVVHCDSRLVEAYSVNLIMTAIPLRMGCDVLDISF